jgi:hypothetical protein
MGNEDTKYNWDPYKLPYMESKHLAEMEVLKPTLL